MNNNQKVSIYMIHIGAILLSILSLVNPRMLAASERTYTVNRWPEGTSLSIVSGTAMKAYPASNLIDGSKESPVAFEKLNGAQIRIDFPAETQIGMLGIVQYGWGNWSNPRTLRIDLSNGRSLRFPLELKTVNYGSSGIVQAIKVDSSCKWFTLTVEDCFADGRESWGGLGEIGPAQIAPTKVDFANDPLDARVNSLLIALTRDTPGPVDITLATADGNRFAHRFDVKTSRRSEFKFALKDFTPASGNYLALDPLRVTSIEAADPSAMNFVDLSIKPVRKPGPLPKWKPLPAIAVKHRIIDGKKWTEGLSATSAGRFGNSTYNGLLTETVHDYWFNAYAARYPDGVMDRVWFDFTIPGITDAISGTIQADKGWSTTPGKSNFVESAHSNVNIDWTHAVWSRSYPENRVFTYRYSVLAPGFLVETNVKELKLSSRGSGAMPLRSGAPLEDEGRFLSAPAISGSVKQYGPTSLLVPAANGDVRLIDSPKDMISPVEPWIVLLNGLDDKRPTLWGDRACGVLITFDRIPDLKWTGDGLTLKDSRGLNTLGISTAFGGLLGDGWDMDKVASRARTLSRMLHTYPMTCREWYRPNDKDFLIRDEYSYYRWGSKNWQMADYAPVPPVMAWDERALGWPKFPGAKDTGILTRFGPYKIGSGSAITYSLPNWPVGHATFPRTDVKPELRDALDKVVAKEFANVSSKAEYWPWQSTVYTGWPSAMLAYPLYSESTQKLLLDQAKSGVIKAFDARNWFQRRELFSGRRYIASGWFDPSTKPAMMGDANSAAGSAWYSLYVYAKYSGDWKTVRELLPVALDTERLFEVINDWAVPDSSSREGVIYDDIDMVTISFAGLSALQRLAEMVGTPEQAKRVAYIRAKTATSNAARFTFAKYVDPENHYNWPLYCKGFGEEGPCMGGLGDSFVVKDQFAMTLAWLVQAPELYNFYMDATGRDFCKAYQSEFVEQKLPSWREMPGNQYDMCSHIAQRAWISDWPEKSLWDDWNAYTRYSGGNPTSVSGGTIAVLLGRGAPYLVNWEPARLISFGWDDKVRTLTASFQSLSPAMVSISTSLTPTSVTCDGVAAKYVRKSGSIRLTMPAGKHQICWQF